jgi:hypothetical protein
MTQGRHWHPFRQSGFNPRSQSPARPERGVESPFDAKNDHLIASARFDAAGDQRILLELPFIGWHY